MGRLWVAVAATVVGVIAVFTSGSQVHFDLTHQNCSAKDSIVSHCISLFSKADWDAYFASDTLAEYVVKVCALRLETIDCVETSVCHCGYASNHTNQIQAYLSSAYLTYYYNNISSCANATYGASIGTDVLGPINATGGVNCTKYNKTIGDYLLTLETMNHPTVVELQDSCDGFRACYVRFDGTAAAALYGKNFHGYCTAYHDLLDCVSNATCACQQTGNDDFVDFIEKEKKGFRLMCDDVYPDAVNMPYGAVCPDAHGGNCRSTEPTHFCYLEWLEAYRASDSRVTLCQAEKEWAYCIETLACECGFFNDSHYFRVLARSKLEYVNENDCENFTGPFPDHVGLNCSDYGGTTEEERFEILTLASVGFLSSYETTCPGVFKCYNDTLDAFNEAYRNKDMQAICSLEAKRYGCLEKAYCGCGLMNDPDVIDRMADDESYFKWGCRSSHIDAEIPSFVCTSAYCETDSPTSGCLEAWREAYYSAFTQRGECVAELEWAYCIESLACECGFFNDSHYFRILARSKLDYVNVSNCESLTGPFPNHTGLNCSDYGGLTEEERLEIVSMESVGFVSAYETTCPGIFGCYNDTMNAFNEAYHNKDMQAICSLEAKRYGCLEETYCGCGLMTDPEVAARMEKDETYFERACTSRYIDAQFLPYVCYGAYCETPKAADGCLEEWRKAFYAAFTTEEECRAELFWAECIENLACVCGFHNNSDYYRALAQSKVDYYNYFQCEDVTGPFPNHTGLNCTDLRNLTEAERFFPISLAEAGFLDTEEARCQGIFQCYNDSLPALNAAFVDKDLNAICEVEAARFGCVDQAYCSCELRWDEDAVAKLEKDEKDFRTWCHNEDVEVRIPQPTCYDCDSLTPDNTCEDEWISIRWAYGLSLCKKLIDLANCTESVACACHFHNEPLYLQHLAVAKHTFDEEDCDSYGLSFPDHDGYDCDGDTMTDQDRLLSIALAQTKFVGKEDQKCPGIQQCYNTSDVRATAAYHSKDLTSICNVEEDRIICVDDKYCACGTLFDTEVYNRTTRDRMEHLKLCYDVTGYMPVVKCRGEAACRQENPLGVCVREFNEEYRIAYNENSFVGQCQSFRNVLLCLEEVGCQCGLLTNGSTTEAAAIYNMTTRGRHVYDGEQCHTILDPLEEPSDDGIQCEDPPDDETLRRLVLFYALSDEISPLINECHRVHKCFRHGDKDIADALWERDMHELCKAQRKLIGCVDEAYCRCGINGTESTETYIAQQITNHNEFCEDLTPITREQCVSLEAEVTDKCNATRKCLTDVDSRLAAALISKNYTQYCQNMTNLVVCLDNAFCECSLNGTDLAIDYTDLQMSYHTEYNCSSFDRQADCRTGAANYLLSSPSILLAALLMLLGVLAP